jgi:hypothetical protein
MQISFGPANTLTRDINSVFGRARVPVQEVIGHFATILGYEASRVEARVDGCIITDGWCTNDTEMFIQTKANTKG